MKVFTVILYLSLALLGLSCSRSASEAQINQLHTESRKIGEETSKKLDVLIQRSNSINIQGRALTQEEIAFTGQVASMSRTFEVWKQNMEKAGSIHPGKKRLNLERQLQSVILDLRKTMAILEQPTR